MSARETVSRLARDRRPTSGASEAADTENGGTLLALFEEIKETLDALHAEPGWEGASADQAQRVMYWLRTQAMIGSLNLLQVALAKLAVEICLQGSVAVWNEAKREGLLPGDRYSPWYGWTKAHALGGLIPDADWMDTRCEYWMTYVVERAGDVAKHRIDPYQRCPQGLGDGVLPDMPEFETPDLGGIDLDGDDFGIDLLDEHGFFGSGGIAGLAVDSGDALALSMLGIGGGLSGFTGPSGATDVTGLDSSLNAGGVDGAGVHGVGAGGAGGGTGDDEDDEAGRRAKNLLAPELDEDAEGGPRSLAAAAGGRDAASEVIEEGAGDD